MSCHRVFKYRVFLAFFAACSVTFLVIKTSKRQRKNDWNYEQLDGDRESEDADVAINFDVSANDVIVFLHIQKTGGTEFGEHLVQHLSPKSPCACIKLKKLRCSCKRPDSEESWLFSRFNFDWPCGLHAGWTELQPCVPSTLNAKEGNNPLRKFLYITILRDPVARFISEYEHRRHGAVWQDEPGVCIGRKRNEDEESDLAPCGQDWLTISLEKFTDCEQNPAKNRQTRMLADLSLADCYNVTGISSDERGKIMLESAKENLKSMPFFGLTEHQRESQFLFEKTFDLKFVQSLEQKHSPKSAKTARNVDVRTRKRIREVNALDVKLYNYAREIFWQRLEKSHQT